MEEMIRDEGLAEVIDTVKDLIAQTNEKIREATIKTKTTALHF